MYPYVIIALDLARERAEEHARRAQRDRYVSEALAARPSLSGQIRRLMALVLAAFSRGSAAIVRHLDDCVADDLGRTLAPTE